MNLQETIRRVLREEAEIELIRDMGLFDFLLYTRVNPFDLFKTINIEDLSMEEKYQFLDETAENSLSRWITDYYYSPLYFKRADMTYEIQSWGGGEVLGELFTNDSTYVSDFELPYKVLTDDKLNELFTTVLYGPYVENIYKKD